MERRQFVIECVRCGEMRLDMLTESEERLINDGVGPVYRQCERCEKTTGWIRGRGATEPETGALSLGRSASVSPASQDLRPVPNGQERIASQSELDDVNGLLQKLEHERLRDSPVRLGGAK